MLDPDYQLFARLVQAGSLSAAARSLGLSPAMASKRLVRLEERLGVKLAHRTTRRLVLTRAGERFHADVLAILAAVEAAEARVAGQEGRIAGPLRVTCPTSFGRLHVAPVIPEFLERHPLLTLDLDLSDTFKDILSDRCDLAIRIGGHVGEELSSISLGASRRVLCAAPTYLARRGEPRNLDDLPAHDLLAAEGQSPWRLEGPDGPVSVPVGGRVRTNSSEAVRELALAGGGIALRSLWDVGDELARGRLRRLLPQVEGGSGVGIRAVFFGARPSPAAGAMIAHLQAVLAASLPPDDLPGAPLKDS